MAIGDVLALFPTVKPDELEITTQGLADGVAVRVKHLPTGITQAVRGLTPATFDQGLRALLSEVLEQVTRRG